VDVQRERANADIARRQAAAEIGRKHQAELKARLKRAREFDEAAIAVFFQAAFRRFMVRKHYPPRGREATERKAQAARLQVPREATFVESWEKPLDLHDLHALLA
jgi:hypothetical protein